MADKIDSGLKHRRSEGEIIKEQEQKQKPIVIDTEGHPVSEESEKEEEEEGGETE